MPLPRLPSIPDGKPRQTIFVILVGFYCLGLSAFRFLRTDSLTFLFLNWNLFLAYLPFGLSTLLRSVPRLGRSRLALPALVGLWVLFFPNAPYILTDLFHLRPRPDAPLWYDLILILSFAWGGLLAGLWSLEDIHATFQAHLGKSRAALAVVALLFLASFGVYIGRYLRWNSWDLFTRPGELLVDVGHRAANPGDHPGTWGVTLLLGVFLNGVYWPLFGPGRSTTPRSGPGES